MSVFHQICFDYMSSTSRNPQKMYSQMWQMLWIGSPSGEQGTRSSSECIKSFCSMKLVNFGTFLNFLFTQYSCPNTRKNMFNALDMFNVFHMFRKYMFNALDMFNDSHFLVYMWRRREHSLRKDL